MTATASIVCTIGPIDPDHALPDISLLEAWIVILHVFVKLRILSHVLVNSFSTSTPSVFSTSSPSVFSTYSPSFFSASSVFVSSSSSYLMTSTSSSFSNLSFAPAILFVTPSCVMH